MIAFQTGIFTAQSFDKDAHALDAPRVTGGPKALSAELSKFFIGINDPLGNNPKGTPFDPDIFNLYRYWQSLKGSGGETLHRDRSRAAKSCSIPQRSISPASQALTTT